MDLTKIDKAIKDSNKLVGEWAKEIEAAGGSIDTGMQKVTKASEEAVKKQKLLIRSIEDEVKSLRAELMKSFNLKDIREIDQRLTEANARLRAADDALFKMQEGQIEMNVKEEASQGGLIASLGKWAARIFTVGAALKLFKDIMGSTEGSTDKLEEAVALLKGGFQGLFRTIVTGEWQQLIKNITDTATATRDLKRATSELEHILAGNTIKRAELFTGLQESREKAAGTKDPKEKQSALQDAIEYQKQITELNVGEIQARLTIDEDYYKKLTGHSKEYYDYLLQQIPNIAKNYETFYSQQEGWQLRLNQLRDKEKLLGTWQRDADGKAILTKSGLTEADKKERHQLELLIFTLKDYKTLQDDLSKKGQWDEYIRGIGEMRNAVGEGDRALVHLTTQLTAAGSQAAEEIYDLNGQIENQVKLLTAAITSGNAAEIKSIAAKIISLKEELSIRERLVRQTILATEQQAMGPLQQALIPGFSVIPSVASKQKTKTPQKQWEETYKEMQNLAVSSSKWAKEQAKDIAKNGKAQEETLIRQIALRKQIVNAVANLISQIGAQIGLDEKAMSMLNAGLDAFTQLVSGDVIGAATSMLSGLISSIPSATSKFEAQITRINDLLAEQQRLIEQSARTGGTAELMEETINTLKELIAVTYREIQKELSKFAPNGKRVDELTETWRDYRIELEKAEQDYEDFLRGEITQNTLADSIAAGFLEGRTSIDDFGEYLNQVLLDAVMNIFKTQYLLPKINEILMPVVNEALADNVITPEEKAKIDATTKTIADMLQGPWKDLTGGLNFGETAAQSGGGLSGAIRREMTEETAGQLSGIMRKMSDDGRQVRDYSKMGVDHLLMISHYTSRTADATEKTNEVLNKTNEKLDTIVTNTNKVYTALGNG
jgi:hypothetical protein